MRHTRHAACAALLAGVLALDAQTVAAAPQDGAEVYRTVCAQCHAAGQAGAPKLGDRKAWAPLIREGQPALTGVAYIGIRGMPPKGVAPGLSLEDFARVTVYMANPGEAGWKDPDTAMLGCFEGVMARQRARQPRSAASGRASLPPMPWRRLTILLAAIVLGMPVGGIQAEEPAA